MHLAAADPSGGHLACLDLLLKVKEVEVDLKDVSWTATSLYTAGKNRNREGVVKLLQAGADPDLAVGQTGKTVGQFLATWLPDLEVERQTVRRGEKKESRAALEQCILLAKTTEVGGRNYTAQCLKFRASAQDLGSPGEWVDLWEVCCRRGLADNCTVLLRRGANPDSFPAVLDAGERGDIQLLKLLRRHEADFTVSRTESRETVLHCLLKSGTTEHHYMQCIDLLLSNQDNIFSDQIRSIVNKSDVNGNTALHYSTEKWRLEVTRALLQLGANIGIKNQWGEIPVSRIPPDLLEAFLSEDCLLATNHPLYHQELELTFKYSFLAPDPASLPAIHGEEGGSLLGKEQEHEQNEQDARALPETESLWYLGQSKEHQHLLRHPVITSFLWFKWERVRPYFNRNLRLYVLYTFLLTWFIFTEYGGHSQRAIIGETFFGLYIGLLVALVISMVRDAWKDIKV